MKTIRIENGKHKGELGVVLEVNINGIRKTLTLEGDIHYYDQQGYEVTAPVVPWRRRY